MSELVLLGFPNEEIVPKDQFVRHYKAEILPGLWAYVHYPFGNEGSPLMVFVSKYKLIKDTNEREVVADKVDGPLAAKAVIYNYINTHTGNHSAA